MGVYIPNMSKPKDCINCACSKFFTDGEMYCSHLAIYLYEERIPEECDLIDVPSHGRLIDADVVIKNLLQYISGEKTLGQCIDECPTVIEKEG